MGKRVEHLGEIVGNGVKTYTGAGPALHLFAHRPIEWSMDHVALVAVLLTSSLFAVASGKGLLSLVLRLMTRYGLPAADVGSSPS